MCGTSEKATNAAERVGVRVGGLCVAGIVSDCLLGDSARCLVAQEQRRGVLNVLQGTELRRGRGWHVPGAGIWILHGVDQVLHCLQVVAPLQKKDIGAHIISADAYSLTRLQLVLTVNIISPCPSPPVWFDPSPASSSKSCPLSMSASSTIELGGGGDEPALLADVVGDVDDNNWLICEAAAVLGQQPLLPSSPSV